MRIQSVNSAMLDAECELSHQTCDDDGAVGIAIEYDWKVGGMAWKDASSMNEDLRSACLGFFIMMSDAFARW